ncbi:uncharacterized protein [Mytilus edulis]|uniref:uncharacterized protein n=1 Tax=Mytilus edulis TaxID=6550 RepID=UPI0039F0C0E7
MASRLSQEEENYVRMCLLMTGISTRAARIVFDREFAPSCLDSTLKRETKKLRNLQSKGKINQIQWNLLFRNKPDSQTFDVTLMITLVRHLTDPKDLIPPHGGYDRLPFANEITPTSDLARIKFYRNFLAHLVDEKIDDTEFTTAWDIVTDAISRLGGKTMKQECDNLKVKILDQSSREIILEIKRSNNEIKELKKSMESLKKANEDMSTDMKKLEMYLKDTVPWNIRAEIKEILDEWKDNDKMFIITRAASNVLKCIKENSCVTITASSGVGKTVTLKHVALQMELEGYDVLLVTDPGDIVKFYNPTQKTLFVIDDLYGNYSLNQTDIKVWEPVMERIERILSNELSKIIVACRLQVYQDEKFESLSIFMSCVCNLVSQSMRLLKAEKESIAEFYLQTTAPEIIKYCDLYDCFPLLCKLYHDNPSPNITDFFQNPFTVYEAEIDKLQKNGCYSKYCALALCVIFNNNLNEEILIEDIDDETRAIIENTFEACRLDRGTARLILQDDFNSLIHTFFKKEKNIYKAIHDKIFDFLVYYFGQKIICCLIKNAHSGLIKERFLLERQNNVDKFVTIVPPKYHQMYIQRMIGDWSKGEVNAVICNINMKIPLFRQNFLCCLNKLDTSYQRQLAHTSDVYNNDTALLILCFKGDIPMIHWCLSHDVDVNQCRNNRGTPFNVAVKKGWTEIVRMMLNMGVYYKKCDIDGCSPLMNACSAGHTEIVRMLLDMGADYDTYDNNGWSPLNSACKWGYIEIVRMLLNIGADYDDCNNTCKSPLMYACRYGFIEIVRMLLDVGADYDDRNNTGISPLKYACTYGYTEIVRMLLDVGAECNACDNNGWSPILNSCKFKHTEIVRMLLDKGADFDKCNNNGWSPLKSACCVGHTEIVRMLLDNGADFDKCNNNGWSPLKSACGVGHTEIVRMLLEKGADYNRCDKNGSSPLMSASGLCNKFVWSPVKVGCSVERTEIVKMLLDKGADYDKCNNNGWSPIMNACKFGHTEIVRMLLDKGADYNKCDKNGWSPIMNACKFGHTEIVRMLLDIVADYNKCDRSGWSAIKNACKFGYTEIVRMLLDVGADRDKCDNNGCSPIMSASGFCYNIDLSPENIACSVERTEIVKMLLDKGADYDKCNNNGWSPIMNACKFGHTEIVRMLLDIEADYNKCDKNGWSPIMNACKFGQTEIVRMLLDIGADYNKCDKNGWSPFMNACKFGHTEIVRMLLSNGADFDKCNNNGWSPLKSACCVGHTEIVRLLLDKGADCNKCDKDGSSPIMSASGFRYKFVWSPVKDGRNVEHTDILKMLLDKGADYNKCNSNGWSPIMNACKFGYTEIVRILLDKGADFDKCNTNGLSPVMISCRRGHTDILTMLLVKGADYNKLFDNDCCLLTNAFRHGHTQIVQMLLDKGADHSVNLSLSSSTFPGRLKEAKVAPIHKKNSVLEKGKYRPVSVLPAISKVFENAVEVQLVQYFDKIFSPFLAAFRSAFGCQTTLLRVIEDWKLALDQN